MKWYVQTVLTLIKPLQMYFLKTAKQGAQTTLYTTLADKSDLVPGEYYADCKIAKRTKMSKNLEEGEKLWKASE